MASAAGSAAACPICRDGFEQPKLLPCAHHVCRKCVLNWLEKGGEQKYGCPLCRVRMVPENLDKDAGDLASQVDALPTNLAIAFVAEGKKTLSDRHVCSCGEEASLYCLQCGLKMCSPCSKTHDSIPSAQGHVTEKLCDLTAEQLAAKRQIFCEEHKAKSAELYCTDHERLLCVECVSTAHSKCSELKGIGDVAPEKREQLKALIEKIGVKRAAAAAKNKALDSEMVDGQATFKAMRLEVKAVFGDLQSSLETQCRKLEDEIQELEDAYLAERKSQVLDLENLEAALSAHVATAEQLVASAPDAALLAMLGKLKHRLESLEAEKLPDDPASTPGRLVVSTSAANLAKTVLAAAVGVVNEQQEEQEDTSCDWHRWCDKCRPEATIRFTIDNISKLKKGVYSPPTVIQNLPWKILVDQRLTGQGDEEKKTMVFSVSCNADSTSTSWSCQAAAEHRLLSALPGRKPECRQSQYLFSHKSKNWGYCNYISWNDLMDPEKGFVQDDTITVEVTIKAEAPQGV